MLFEWGAGTSHLQHILQTSECNVEIRTLYKIIDAFSTPDVECGQIPWVKPGEGSYREGDCQHLCHLKWDMGDTFFWPWRILIQSSRQFVTSYKLSKAKQTNKNHAIRCLWKYTRTRTSIQVKASSFACTIRIVTLTLRFALKTRPHFASSEQY